MRRDLLVGLAAALVQVACNVARLILVSTGAAAFEYWHDGPGRHAFAVAATLAAILVAFLGASWACPPASQSRAAPARRRGDDAARKIA